MHVLPCERLTSPARLGRQLIEEVVELSELTEDALGLLSRPDLLRELLVLVGVVQGKPIRVTLWTGAKSPYLGMHWKYLRGTRARQRQSTFSPFSRKPRRRLIFADRCSANLPGARHRSVVLPEGFVQLHSAPLSLGEVRLPQKPNHSCLCTTHLHEKRKHKLEPGSADGSD